MEDGIFLYDPEVPLQEVGELANLVRERINGKRWLLQHQYSPQPDKRLRLPMSVLRISF